MRTLRTIAVIGLVVMLGCESKTAVSGALQVNMSANNTTGYERVKVEILGVEVKFADHAQGNRGWTPLEVRPGIYDLVHLESDMGFVLAEHHALEPGRIVQVRLKFGIKNSVTVSGNNFPMELPDGTDRTFTIDLKTQVDPGKRTEFTLNVDVGQSVTRHDNGTFSFNPVLQVRNINQFDL